MAASNPQSSQIAFWSSGLMTTCPLRTTTEDSCSICLEPCTEHIPNTCPTKAKEMPATITIRACGHFFHPTCLFTWLEAHSTCPMCRAKLFKKMVWVYRLMVFLPDREGRAKGLSELITLREWTRRMKIVGYGLERDALMEAEWMQYYVEVEEGGNVQMY